MLAGHGYRPAAQDFEAILCDGYQFEVPCIKGQNSVKARITFLQNHQIIVLPKCKNLIKELSNFSYIKDRHTDKYTEKMTHEYSHAIDGLGYAYSDIYTNNRLRTLDKAALGL